MAQMPPGARSFNARLQVPEAANTASFKPNRALAPVQRAFIAIKNIVDLMPTTVISSEPATCAVAVATARP